MKVALKVMPPILLCQLMISEEDVGDIETGWTFPPIFYSIFLSCDRWQQRDSLTKWCLTWKCIWNKCVTEFHHAEKKNAPINIHQCLLNVYRDQTINVSSVRWWVMCFNSGVVTATVGHICCCRYLYCGMRLSFTIGENV